MPARCSRKNRRTKRVRRTHLPLSFSLLILFAAYSLLLLQAFSPLMAAGAPRVRGDEGGSEGEEYCVVLAKPGVLYLLRLDTKDDTTTGFSLWFSFNYSEPASRRLHVNDSLFEVESQGNFYHVMMGVEEVCRFEYVGLEGVLLGEACARLHITSENYTVWLAGVEMPLPEPSTTVLPESLTLIVALCSLIPFFLLIPDAMEGLQEALEQEQAGVYVRLLALLLPLVSAALTLLLIQTLAPWVVWT